MPEENRLGSESIFSVFILSIAVIESEALENLNKSNLKSDLKGFNCLLFLEKNRL